MSMLIQSYVFYVFQIASLNIKFILSYVRKRLLLLSSCVKFLKNLRILKFSAPLKWAYV